MASFADYNSLFRYFHILSGITWIGLLYFFNFVNAPLLKVKLSKPYDVDMAEKATGNITLKALFWFRWGAMSTLVFGLLLVGAEMQDWHAATGKSGMGYFLDNGYAGYSILTGVVFAIVMWFNVWFIIWPNQQVILRNNKRIAAGAPEEEKKALQADNAPRVKKATMASRANTWLSVPMLFGMVFGAHGADDTAFGVSVVVLLIFLVLLAFFANRKPAAPKKA